MRVVFGEVGFELVGELMFVEWLEYWGRDVVVMLL